MISVDRALVLEAAGLRWHPEAGDRFVIRQPDLIGDVFTISDLVVEAYEFATGTVLGFNGTTEWALDSVVLEEALWLPREDQLRELLGRTFRAFVRRDGGYDVVADLPGHPGQTFSAAEPADAYADALLGLLTLSAL
jgi:hypothetical protein